MSNSNESDSKKPKFYVKHKVIKAENRGMAPWKIAYADFVTAMMAFFLLLWLLNASVTVDLAKLGNSFIDESEPTELTASGSKEIRGGSNLNEIDSDQPVQNVLMSDISMLDETEQVVLENFPDSSSKTSSPFFQRATEEQSDHVFQLQSQEKSDIVQALRRIFAVDVDDRPALEVYSDEFGVNFELLNEQGQHAFRRNSAEITETLRHTLLQISRVLTRYPNKIMIVAHSAEEGTEEESWNLSLLRANAVRQVLVRMGISREQIFGIAGKGATDPILPEDPESLANVRIQMTLISEEDKNAAQIYRQKLAPPDIQG